MTARARRTTTLAGPNRFVLAAATGGLVALASAGTALLVLTGTSSVAPIAAPAPPLPSSTPLTRPPGVVVLPSDEAGRLAIGGTRQARAPHRRPTSILLPLAPVPTPVAVTDLEVPAAPPVPAVRPAPPAQPALVRAPSVPTPAASIRPGRHLAKGHDKHPDKHPDEHGKHLGWTHSLHWGAD